MKTLGITRKLDELGRIVLPMELRRTFNIKERDELEIYVDNGSICLRPIRKVCDCCEQEKERLREIGKIRLCQDCINNIGSGKV